MTTLRAHFDGRVLVPDEPVDLPRNRSLEVQVREVEEPIPTSDVQSWLCEEPDGFPVFRVPLNAKKFGLADVQRAEDEP